MNKSTKESLASFILSHRPDAKVEFTIHRTGSEKEAKALAEEVSNVISGKTELLENGGSHWYRVRAPEAEVTLFFGLTDEDRKERLEKRLAEIKREEESVQKLLDSYMIEDVKFEEEEVEL